jgi:hypothetical protein
MNRARLASAALGALAALLSAMVKAQPAAELPGSTYASIARLPDWSGWWGHSTVPAGAFRAAPPPFKPEVVAQLRATDPDADALRYCRPPVFTGSSGGFTEAVELLFTPGRVTLTNERGMIRRIYTGGQTIPADLDPTNTGVSVGRWEREALVVETTLINPRALLAGAPIGEGARITERISLVNPNTLAFDVEVVAPEVLTAPYRRTQTYERLPKMVASEITFCTEYDRSIDPSSGAQRFDMTPPAGLAPPPGR